MLGANMQHKLNNICEKQKCFILNYIYRIIENLYP